MTQFGFAEASLGGCFVGSVMLGDLVTYQRSKLRSWVEPAWTPSWGNLSFVVSMASCYNGGDCQPHQRSESKMKSLVFIYSRGQRDLENLTSFKDFLKLF